jgi:hypothetical protein
MAARLGLVLYILSLVLGIPIGLLGLALIFISTVPEGKIVGGAVIVMGLFVIGVGRGILFVLAGR